MHNVKYGKYFQPLLGLFCIYSIYNSFLFYAFYTNRLLRKNGVSGLHSRQDNAWIPIVGKAKV